MKNLYLLFALSFLAFSSQAQNTFAPDGAEWHYKGDAENPLNGSGREFLIHYKATDDSIQGLTRFVTVSQISQMQAYTFNFTANRAEYTLRTVDTSTLHLKVTEDTVFYFNPLFDKYTPLYIFNASVGDTLKIPITDTASFDYLSGLSLPSLTNPDGDSVITFIVDSIVNQNYNGTLLKTFHVSTFAPVVADSNGLHTSLYPTFNWITSVDMQNYVDSNYVKVNGSYTQAFSGVGSGLFPTKYGVGWWVDAPFKIIKICSYEDSAININLSNGGCDTFRVNTSLGIAKNLNKENLKIYPNPGDGTIYLEGEASLLEGAQISVIDAMGRTILQTKTVLGQRKLPIDLKGNAAGLYLIILRNKNSRYGVKYVLE